MNLWQEQRDARQERDQQDRRADVVCQRETQN